PRRGDRAGRALARAAHVRLRAGRAHRLRPAGPARETAGRLRAAPLRGDEPRGDRGVPGHEPGDGQEQPAPRGPSSTRAPPGGPGMIFDHLRYRPKVSLLAFGALEGRERAATERHAGSCARCRSELEALLALREELRADPVRGAEPALPLPMLVARVEARVSEALASPRGRWAWRLGVGLPAAAAIVAIALLAPRIASRFTPVPPPPAGVDEPPVVSAEALARLQRHVPREQAARYLSDAGDVLVTVAAAP